MARNKKQYSKKELETPKEIIWIEEPCFINDNTVLLPVCPTCKEPAYRQDRCVFCNQLFIWVDKPKEREDVTVTYGEYSITQIDGSWSLYIEKDDELAAHMVCTRKYSEEELLNTLKRFVKRKEKK